MISLTVTGHAEPEQSRDEIEHRLQKYGVGAVCLLRNGGVSEVIGLIPPNFVLLPASANYYRDGRHCHPENNPPRPALLDIIRVFPPGTRLRVTVEVVE